MLVKLHSTVILEISDVHEFTAIRCNVGLFPFYFIIPRSSYPILLNYRYLGDMVDVTANRWDYSAEGLPECIPEIDEKKKEEASGCIFHDIRSQSVYYADQGK
ncbi:hypothetical protein RB195_017409 [Necator americanus]